MVRLDSKSNTSQALSRLTFPNVHGISTTPVAVAGSIVYDTITGNVYYSNGLIWILLSPNNFNGFSEFINTNNAVLSPFGTSIIDTRTSALNLTLPAPSSTLTNAFTLTPKTVMLVSKAGMQATIATPLGTFILTPDDSTKQLEWSTIDDGFAGRWSITNSLTNSFYPTTQQAKLIGTGGVPSSTQGHSVAMSADGTTVASGGQNDNSGVGAVWIFTLNSTTNTWSQQGAKLVGTGATGNAGQGISVALSADGNTLAVGGTTDNTNVGAVWIFTRSNGVWTQQGNKLVGTGSVGTPRQGSSVALSADGNTLAEGGPVDNTSAGAVWIFTRSNGVWTQQGSKLVGSGATGTTSEQGASVALSADGNTLAEGGPGDNASVGAEWVFTRLNGTWTQQGSKLVGTGNTGASQQGTSIALSADGNTMATGGPFDNTNVGAVWIFVRANGAWTQQAFLNVTTPSSIGTSVALTSDGNMLSSGGAQIVFDFTRSGGNWTQQNSLLATGNIGSDAFGESVAVSTDGNYLVGGGPIDNSNVGAIWIFT